MKNNDSAAALIPRNSNTANCRAYDLIEFAILAAKTGQIFAADKYLAAATSQLDSYILQNPLVGTEAQRQLQVSYCRQQVNAARRECIALVA